MLSKRAFDEFRKRIDYSEYGGAPLLGVRGITIIGHGRSNPNAIKNAIRVAAELCRCARERKNRTGAFRLPPQSPPAAEPERNRVTTMSKLAFLFPGQASQYPGMGKDLAENFPESRAVFDEADAALGFSLSNFVSRAPKKR